MTDKIVLIIILLIAITICVIDLYYARKQDKTKMSFKESMDLTDLPIVTFYSTVGKLNFLLDSGSNKSFISSKTADLLRSKYSPDQLEEKKVFGSGGKASFSESFTVKLEYKKAKYESNLIVNSSLDMTFRAIKRGSGAKINGILGTDFLDKYNYVLDFADLIAYRK